MNEGQEGQKPTPASRGVDNDICNSVASSWLGDIGGLNTAIYKVSKNKGLYSYDSEGSITNEGVIYNQIVEEIYNSGAAGNRIVEDVIVKLVENAKRAVNIDQYKDLEKQSRGSAAGLIRQSVLSSFGKEKEPIPEIFSGMVTDALSVELAKELPENKPQGIAATPPSSQNNRNEDEESRREKQKEEDTEQEEKDKQESEEEKKGSKDKEDKDKPEEGEGRTEHRPDKNEFEDDTEADIRQKKDFNSDKKPGEQGQDSEKGKDYDPDKIKNNNKQKGDGGEGDEQGEESSEQETSENNEEDEQGNTNSNKQSKKKKEDEKEEDLNGKERPDQPKNKESTKTGEEPKTDGSKPGQDKSGNTQSSNQPQNQQTPQNNSSLKNPPDAKIESGQPSSPSSQLKPAEGPINSAGAPKNTLPTTDSIPSSGNLAPRSNLDALKGQGNLNPQGRGGGRISIRKSAGQNRPTLKLPTAKPLSGQGLLKPSGLRGGGRIAGNNFSKAANNLVKPALQTGSKLGSQAAQGAAKGAAKLGTEAAKLGAQLAARAAQALASLAAQGLAALAALGAPAIIIIVIIAIIIGFMLAVIVFSACPGINPAAQKTTEIVGADKMKFNEKLDEKCKPKNNNACGPTSTANFGVSNGKITPEECAKAKEFWPLFQASGRKYGVDPYILAGIAKRESNFTLGLSNGQCSGKGDSGFGHGIMQIDSGTWMAYLSKGTWVDCADNIDFAAKLVRSNQDQFKEFDLRQQLNAYNAGRPCSDGTDSCTTKNYGTGTLQDIATTKDCIDGGINIPSPSRNVAKNEKSGPTQNFLAFNPFASVGVSAQGSLPFDAWLPPGNSFNIDRDSNFRTTQKFVVLDSSGGVDFTLAPPGKSYEESRNVPIVAHLAGEVTYIDNPGPQYQAGSFGNMVAVYYPSLNKTIAYSHLETVDVKPGDAVSPGSLLGRQGSSGSAPDNYIHVDFRMFDGKVAGAGVQNSGLAIDKTKSLGAAIDEYSTVFSDILKYYNANSDKIAASNFSPTAPGSSSSSDPCPPGTSGRNKSNAKGSQSLLNVARRVATGKPSLGKCYDRFIGVAAFIEEAGFAGIAPGTFLSQPMDGDQGCAVGFSEHYNIKSNAQAQGIVNLLDANPNYSPYDAPAGSIVVVTAGSPGTAHPFCGDISVADGNDNFYNDGEMDYGGASAWNGSRGGNGRVLGIYVPI